MAVTDEFYTFDLMEMGCRELTAILTLTLNFKVKNSSFFCFVFYSSRKAFSKNHSSSKLIVLLKNERARANSDFIILEFLIIINYR